MKNEAKMSACEDTATETIHVKHKKKQFKNEQCHLSGMKFNLKSLVHMELDFPKVQGKKFLKNSDNLKWMKT